MSLPEYEPSALDPEAEEILADPELRAALDECEDEEERQDFLEGLKVERRIERGEEKYIPYEDVKRRLGL